MSALHSNQRGFYLSWFCVYLLLLAGIVAGFNAVVDPQARLLVLDAAGFNEAKVALQINSRKGKSNALRQCYYDAIVLGTSRAETAISMDHPTLRGTNPYNASLRAGTMYEMARLADYAIQNGDLKLALISLDYESFNARKSFAEDFEDSQLAENPSVASTARYLFSTQTLGQSIDTLEQNIRGKAKLCADRGEHKRTYDLDAARKAFDFILPRYATGQYGQYVPGDMHIQNFAAMLRNLAAADVEIQAYISPMHVTHLQLIAELGLLNDYENWKRKLVKVVAEVNRETNSVQKISLWDFSGYSDITTEKVPDPARQKHMRWFDDSSHVNQRVGNIMLNRMLGQSDTEPDFGIVLTPDNIDAQIEADRRGAERYRRDNKDEILRLQQMLSSLEQ